MQCSSPHRSLLIICSMLLLTACSGSYSLVAFEVLEPATLIFPENVSQLLLLNRLPASHRMFDEEETGDLGTRQLLMLDTLISNNIFRGLYDVLRDSPIRNFHWPIWSSERQPELMVKNDIILAKREVAELCLKNCSDVILSLEAFHLDISSKQYSLLEGTIFGYNLQLISKSTWFVYLPESPRPYDEFEVLDTMVYITGGDIKTPRPFPSNDMIKRVSHSSGSKYGRHITPVWEKTERNIYTAYHPSLRKGSKHTSEGDWEQAYILWNRLSIKGNSRNRAKACFNMAVYFELEDNLDSASYLIDRAIANSDLKLIRSYREELDTRMKKNPTIIKQVER